MTSQTKLGPLVGDGNILNKSLVLTLFSMQDEKALQLQAEQEQVNARTAKTAPCFALRKYLVHTEWYNVDLTGMLKKLRMMFEEISECYTALRRADSSSTIAVIQLFKKSSVHHLRKHLAPLETMLVVMKRVLRHDYEYSDFPPNFGCMFWQGECALWRNAGLERQEPNAATMYI